MADRKGKEKLDPDDTTIVVDSDGELEKHTVFSENGETLYDGQEAPKRVMYTSGTFDEDRPKFQAGNGDIDEIMEAQMSQLHYNNNRLALDRAISTVIHLLSELQEENNTRSTFYPLNKNEFEEDSLNDDRSIQALRRRSTMENLHKLRENNIEINNINELNEEVNNSTPFKVLNINLKMTGDRGNLISNLDKKALSKLLDEKLQANTKHLLSLRKRIDDTTSKVFVTGDLNSGKSTFCNALLRRKLLPEDQQPCTSVFCEVSDCRDNDGLEEVHAVSIGSQYKKGDESTYSVFQLKELEELVGEYDKFSLLKVYVNDKRSIDRSLLRNGVIDINLIDSPGLNMDSYQTTELFSRQEEIDLVVFVVSAENHFTLSAREFITAAAKEKQFIFIVVNKFDSIENKERCIQRILKQVQSLSPETHKDARDFVHFVSSSNTLKVSGGGNGGGDGDSDPNNSSNNNDSNFDHLESSLRKFVLEKRALSKLAPAKNFLIKILGDLENLSKFNEELYDKDRERITNELNELIPIYDAQLSKNQQINVEINEYSEQVVEEVYKFSKKKLSETIKSLDQQAIEEKVDFDNSLYDIANQIQNFLIGEVLKGVEISENYARKKTIEGINSIKQKGQEILNDETFLKDKVFREDFMFQRKKHYMIKKINREISILDFIDPSFEGLLSLFGVHTDFIPDFGSIFTKGSFSWKNYLSLIFLGSSTKLLATKNVLWGLTKIPFFGKFLKSKTFLWLTLVGASGLGVYYLFNDMPHAFKRKYAKKLECQLDDIDYVTGNSLRISKECRLVLQYPVKEITKKFDNLIASNFHKKQKLVEDLKNMDVGITFYRKFTKRCNDQKNLVNSFNLEGIYEID